MFLKQKLSVALMSFIATGSAMANAQQIEITEVANQPEITQVSKVVKPRYIVVPALVKQKAVRVNMPTATTIPSTTTTTILPIPDGLRCPQYYNLAKDIGWPEDQLERLDLVMWRESRCDTSVHNTKDPSGGSRGLIQINGYWCRKNTYNPNGFLQQRNIVETCEDLFDPLINLTAGLEIYNYGIERHKCGWGPWSTRSTKWCQSSYKNR